MFVITSKYIVFLQNKCFRHVLLGLNPSRYEKIFVQNIILIFLFNIATHVSNPEFGQSGLKGLYQRTVFAVCLQIDPKSSDFH